VATVADWLAVAQAESSGNWANNDTGGNGHFGGLQFSPGSWAMVGGTGGAAGIVAASPAEQIARANALLAVQGWGAWPDAQTTRWRAAGQLPPTTGGALTEAGVVAEAKSEGTALPAGGTSSNATDASLTIGPNLTGTNVVGGLEGAVSGVTSGITDAGTASVSIAKSLASIAVDIGTGSAWLSKPENWIRILEVVGGIAAAGFAVHLFATTGTAGSGVAQATAAPGRAVQGVRKASQQSAANKQAQQDRERTQARQDAEETRKQERHEKAMRVGEDAAKVAVAA
jgi:hypothetical protein